MSHRISCPLDEAAGGCLMLMLGLPLLFILLMLLDAASWPCRILLVLAITTLLLCPQHSSRPPPTAESPRPSITWLPALPHHTPYLRLQRGQILTVPHPHSTHLIIPAGLTLQILEATPRHIRVTVV